MVAEASRKKPTAVFIAFGTKGDVYPISAIAAAFASDQKQYEVSFVTHSAHEVWNQTWNQTWMMSLKPLLYHAFLYEKVKAMRPDLREGGDTLLPILKFSSKRWIYNSVWPELQKLTISNIKIWECENCNTCEVKSLTSQEVKSLETRGPRFPKTRDVDVVNEYSAQVMNVGGDAYVQVLMLGAIEQATSENEELGRYMSYYGPQKIADCLKADLKADSWQLLETLNDNLLGYSSASAQQFVSIDDESVAFDLDRKTDIDEAPVVSAAPAAPVVPAAAVAPAVPAAAVALALNTLQLEFSKNLKGHLGAKGVEYFPISSPPVLSSVQEYHFGGSTDGSFSMRKKEITKKHRQECLSVVERIYGGAPIMDGDLIIINFFALEGWSLAELFNVRCVVAAPYVVPYSAPSSFERQFRNELPLLYNYLREAPTGKAGWDDVIHWMWPLFTEAWGTWRSHDLQLSFWPFTDPVTGLPTWHVRPSSTLLLYGFSQEVVECPGYWPSAVRVCGFWFPPAEWQFSCTTCAEISSLTSLRKLNAENELCSIHATLKRFLDSSAERPIFLCLSSVGSMGYLRNPQAFLQVLGDVLNITNRSIILLSAGYGPLDAAIKMFAQTQSSATEQMQFSEIQSCLFEGRLFCYSGAIPYSWIFPRCAAAIHHGGSGSTAAALRTGIPQVICPFILDQFYWAERMFWLGVASEPLNSACLLPDKDDDTCISKAAKVLVGAINYALSPEVKLRAAQIADRISNEDGVSTALQIIKKEILCIDAPN